MENPLVIRGTFVNKAFVPEGPLPDAEGPAEMIVDTQASAAEPPKRPSIYDVLGKAKRLRTAEELDARLEEECASWGDE
jgi:hypothetical protein